MTVADSHIQSNVYDAVPYVGALIPNASPDHLALCSLASGGPRPRLESYRLVELGCGDGANLLPLAFYHPDSTFVGVDSSRVAIEQARRKARAIGLKNLVLLHKDVRDLERAGIPFCDYVIAHGLYSWVPEDARIAILEFCANHLTADGIASISYNAQPGWATRNLVRETLLRSRWVQEAPARLRAQRAIELAGKFLEDLPSREYASAMLFADELKRVRHGNPSYVFHEYLADYNEGFWLRDFVEQAQQQGLDYVADAQDRRWEGQMPVFLREAATRRSQDPLERQELADLLCHRYFRASILCLRGAGAGASAPELLDEASIAANCPARTGTVDLSSGVEQAFSTENGVVVTLDGSVTKAAALWLTERWPQGTTFDRLMREAISLLARHGIEAPADAREELRLDLTALFESGQIELRLHEPVASEEMPAVRLHALARFEIAQGAVLSTAYHQPLCLPPPAQALAKELDLTQTHETLQTKFGTALVKETIPLLRSWGLLEGPDVP